MLLFVAHPDDEVIFFAPLLHENSVNYDDNGVGTSSKPTVVCMTCRDHPVRSREFKEMASLVGYRYIMYDIPIIRGLSFENYREILQRVLSNVSSDTTECATHSLYGDDHFHPQHVLLSIAVTYVCVRQGIRLYVADCSYNTFRLFIRVLKRTDWMKLKSIALLPIKLFLVIIHKILFTSSKSCQAEEGVLESANLIYLSQSLDYPSFVENSYRFSSLREVFRFKNSHGRQN